MKNLERKLIENAKIIFFDFDGVIKESVDIKTKIFRDLFKPYGAEVEKSVVNHHLNNAGISRFIKIPFYFSEYIGRKITKEEEKEFLKKFYDQSIKKVVESEWVPGVENLLRKNPYKQKFVLVTGTPQKDITIILHELKLFHSFKAIYGAPKEKSDAVKEFLKKNKNMNFKSIFIGDAMTDYVAAKENKIEFLLRLEDNVSPNLISSTNYQIKDFNILSNE